MPFPVRLRLMRSAIVQRRPLTFLRLSLWIV